MESNFIFIKKKFPETYARLFEAEKSVRVNHEIDVRRCFESLIREYVKLIDAEWVFEKYKEVIDYQYPNLSLDLKIKVCTHQSELKRIGYKSKKTIFPHLEEYVKCEYIDGAPANLPAYKFLRLYGNARSHVDDNNIKITYGSSVKALSLFYRILFVLCRELNEELPERRNFTETMMPIQGEQHLYYIDDANIPSDAPMSKCQMEYRAHFDTSGSIKEMGYALIRQYKKQDVDKVFLLRNIDTILKMQTARMDYNLPPCMVRPEQLSTIDNNNSPFYIIAYHFLKEKPRPLSGTLLKKLDMKTRLSICVELARCMADLHGMGVYQRLLTYQSVYLCDYSAQGNGVRPHLIKFDFAKLNSQPGDTAFQTIIDQAHTAIGKIEKESVKKYIQVTDWANENWEKADIYSLGVLFSDILTSRINPNYDVMIDSVAASQEIPNSLCEFLNLMTGDSAPLRPSASEVQGVMETEIKKWS